MATIRAQILAAVLLLGVAGAAAEEVIQLTTAAFDNHVRDNKQTLVEFYAPWCGHCKKLAPEYEKAANKLKPQDIKLAKIDATEEKELASKFNVKGFPTLIWFEEGKDMEYDGTRTADGIIEWVNSMIAPPVSESAPRPAPSDRPQLTLYADAMLPGYLDSAKINRRKAEWYFVKSSVRYPKIVLTHKGEDPVELSTWGTPDKEQIDKFLKENLMPLWGSLDGETFDKYMEASKGLVWSLFPSEGAGMDGLVAKHRPMMQEVAKKIKDTYHVTYTDIEKFKEAINNMLSISKFPAIAVQKKAGDKKKYIYDGEMTAPLISQFIQDVDAGRVDPRLKTQKEPAANDQPILRVVGTTLKDLVFTPNKDVLLEVYAPWCGHCKKLEPEINKLAQKIKKDELTDLLSVAWIDGTENDSPVDSMDWSGFPTLYWVKAGQQTPMVYDGERTAKGLWKYMKKHATHAQEIKERLERKKGHSRRAEEL